MLAAGSGQLAAINGALTHSLRNLAIAFRLRRLSSGGPDLESLTSCRGLEIQRDLEIWRCRSGDLEA